MIDPDGFRPNVGIVLARSDGRVFWARRAGRGGWQFPQGGMNTDETPVEAMYRELTEETGLVPGHVRVLGQTPGWLRYRLPRRFQRRHQRPVCIGQKQGWFLLQFLADDRAFDLSFVDRTEFAAFSWVVCLLPVDTVISLNWTITPRHHTPSV